MIYKVNDNEQFHLELLIDISEKNESITFDIKFTNKMTGKNWKHWYVDDQFSQALAKYRTYEDMFFLTKDTCTDPRRFFVETPEGLIRVQAKTDNDDPSDYPGVYIDLINSTFRDDGLLACVEFDSCAEQIQTCVYDPNMDEPVFVHRHAIAEEES